MRQGALRWAKAALVALIVFALDWVSKRGVESSIVTGEERRFLPGIELVHTRNRGVAFGLFAGAGDVVTIAIAVAVIALLVYFVRRSRSSLIWLPAGMLIGGALGNVVDRLRDGAVTDFIKLPLGWPPFNLADAAITIGVLILALLASQSAGGGER